ncbi:MAG: alpha-galactosidase [Dehalococcoidia bacterium]|nr:MAG: alpha-galactosidase [Dehalococcoidia bacterium]
MPQQVTVRKTRSGLLIANRWLEVCCRLDQGSLAFRDRSASRTVIRRAHAAVELMGGDVVSSLDGGFQEDYDVQRLSDIHGGGATVCLSTLPNQHRHGLHLSLTLYDAQPFAVMQLEVVNGSPQPVSVESFRVLVTPTAGRGRLGLGRSSRRWRFYKHGWQSWSPTLSLSCAQDEPLVLPPIVAPSSVAPQKGCFTGELVGLVADPTTGASLLVGFVTAADQLSRIRLELPGGRQASSSLSAMSYADGITVAPGQGLVSEKLLVDVTGPPLDALARYADALGRQMGGLSWEHVPSGWCSWYYYFGGVSEQAILENLEFLHAHRHELALEYIQVDDGYQADIGDWTTIKDKFPHGLAWLAERIHQKGFKAGLWLAPFLAASTSALYREHPEWMVHDGDGRPVVAIHNWGKECYALDCTHPGAQAWLSHVAGTMVDQCGFDYLKLDFIYAGAVEGRRYDRQATRAQAYRRGLEAIRRGTSDAFILGCGAPLGPSVGLVNAQRIGPDVAAYWRVPSELVPPDWPSTSVPACENAIRSTLTRLWTHDRLWLNDPDCLLVRDSEAALSLDEVRSLATAIALSGGMVFLSDAMAKLPPERLNIASLLLPPYGQSAVALDVFERSLPRFVQLAIERSFQRWWLLGVFQWDDEPSEVTAPLPAEPVHVFDLWQDRYFGVHQEEIRFPAMPPHSAKLLSLRPVTNHPQVISTKFHFSQGAAEIEDARFDAAERALTVRLTPRAKREGEVIIHVPPPYQERRLESDAPGATMARRPDGLLSVRLTLPQRTLFTVFFKG